MRLPPHRGHRRDVGGAEAHAPPGASRIPRVLFPVLIIVVAVIIDLSTPASTRTAPLLVAAPVVAAATISVLATAAVALVAVGLTVATHLYHDLWGDLSADMALASAAAVGLASIAAAVIRRKRERELKQVRSVAAAAQLALLRPPPPRIGRLALRSVYLAAEAEAQIGGDLYEALHTPFGARVLIGDVRGKGLPAVGVSAVLTGCFREAAHREPTIGEVAGRMEETAQREIDRDDPSEAFSERFTTALLVEIPPDEPVARIVHLGHPEPLLIGGGQVTSHPPARPGLPIGLGGLVGTLPVPQTIAFRPGERLLLYTDGFIEARDEHGVYFPLAGSAARHAAVDLDGLVAALRADLLRHTRRQLSDDAALLVIERLPDTPPPL
ncbi:PP2C family protein-serine/threonine phosphatase [Streptomyces sp. WMMC500]|uniref:PP2C family protein-serine/threonine phosphatase n=1 Tax=Streptomyces sp. WMMC500 TaxID=3015154 RepID=UPI00248D05CE|nr:PP2C family protein-serine/threonine phosphatase [Streptomyces sp. WMMC500]WBB59023.1 PP2C family protein-serine/threonine phosphatase [Streptomyces sp. WMMC500]